MELCFLHEANAGDGRRARSWDAVRPFMDAGPRLNADIRTSASPRQRTLVHGIMSGALIVMETQNSAVGGRVPWNKGKLTGQKPPLKLRKIWAIRTRLQMSSNIRELAIFNLAIDSKGRAI